MALIFQKDGKIKVIDYSASEDIFLLPGNGYSLLEYMNERVIFEPGVSALTIMRTLSPWSAAIEAMTGINYSAWLTEAEKTPDSECDKKILRLELQRIIEIDHSMSDGIPVLHDYWRLTSVCRNNEGNYTCPPSLTPMPSWSRLPIKISKTAVLFETDPTSDADKSKGYILAEPGPSIRAIPGIGNDIYGRETEVDSDPTLLSCIVYGFFSEVSLYGNPSGSMSQPAVNDDDNKKQAPSILIPRWT